MSLTRTHTLACWKLQRGIETGLPSTKRKRMEEEGKERKEKPGVTLSSKKKSGDKVKSENFAEVLQHRAECGPRVWLCSRQSKVKVII